MLFLAIVCMMIISYNPRRGAIETVQFLCQVIPKDFKKQYSQVLFLALSTKEILWKSPASSLAISLV